MNKVICDVCGTMYPDNASNCPICGCAKPADTEVLPADGAQGENAAGEYSYTKGGHFSKSNVRKRSKAAEKATKAVAAAEIPEEADPEQEENSGESNKGLIIAIILLIIAILGMLCYIFFTYFAPDLFGGETEPSAVISTTTEATQTDPIEISCQDLELQVPATGIVLNKVGHAWLLEVTPSPADTTDRITYISSDLNVAVVSAEGRVTAVGAGTASIIVKCGSVVKECQVVCNFDEEPTTEATTEPTVEETTEPTTEPTTKPTEPEVDVSKFYLYPRRDGDCTIDVDESFTLQLRDGNGKRVDVEWTATVEGYFSIKGDVITGLKPTPIDANEAHNIRAVCTYEGVEFYCIIRVRYPVSTEPVEPPTTTEYDGPTIDDPGYKISHTDVTIGGNEPTSFTLELRDADGKLIDAAWESSVPGVVTINGNVITCKTKGTTVVSFRVANWVYECTVRSKSTVTDDGAVG